MEGGWKEGGGGFNYNSRAVKGGGGRVGRRRRRS